jgi:hypothetical protein
MKADVVTWAAGQADLVTLMAEGWKAAQRLREMNDPTPQVQITQHGQNVAANVRACQRPHIPMSGRSNQ